MVKKKKRVVFSYLKKGWQSWKMFGDYGILATIFVNENDDLRNIIKNEGGIPIKVKVTIEEI